MTTPKTAAGSATGPNIDLRDPWLAAFLAWLVPGLGHMYQRRWGKGGLFMACILSTFIYGLWLGGGRVVYASFREPNASEWRWAYLPQLGAGLPALPAVVQAFRTSGDNPKAPLWGGFMAPPMMRGQIVPRGWVETQRGAHPDDREYSAINFRTDDRRGYVQYIPGIGGGRIDPSDRADQLSEWHYRLGSYFDLGTVFTMIAGLLNILVVWDAFGGPLPPTPAEAGSKKKESEEELPRKAPPRL